MVTIQSPANKILDLKSPFQMIMEESWIIRTTTSDPIITLSNKFMWKFRLQLLSWCMKQMEILLQLSVTNRNFGETFQRLHCNNFLRNIDCMWSDLPNINLLWVLSYLDFMILLFFSEQTHVLQYVCYTTSAILHMAPLYQVFCKLMTFFVQSSALKSHRE